MQYDNVLKVAAVQNALRKGKAIKTLGITPDLPQSVRDEIAINLSTAKAIENGKEVSDYLNGQEWYINMLCDFSALTAEERFTSEYEALKKAKAIDEANEDDAIAIIADQM